MFNECEGRLAADAVIESTGVLSNASSSTVVEILVESAMRARAWTVLAQREKKKAELATRDLFLACRFDTVNAGPWRRRPLMRLAINLLD